MKSEHRKILTLIRRSTQGISKGMWHALFALLTVFSPSAQAQEVWNYRLESQGVVKSGKLKLTELERKSDHRSWKFRYKLETSVGHKEGWIPYHLPELCFDAAWLAQLPLGKEIALGAFPHSWEAGRELHYKIRRLGESQFQLANEEAKILFSPDAKGVWRRVEAQFQLSSVNLKLFGSLFEISDE